MGMTPKYERLRKKLRTIGTSEHWYLSRSDRDAVAHAERVITKLVNAQTPQPDQQCSIELRTHAPNCDCWGPA